MQACVSLTLMLTLLQQNRVEQNALLHQQPCEPLAALQWSCLIFYDPDWVCACVRAGECYKDDFHFLGDEESDEEQDGLFWPNNAKHDPDYFQST